MYTFKVNLKIPKSELDELRDALPHKSITKISKTTGFHRNSITAVLNGEYHNDEIIEACCAHILKRHDKVINARQIIHDTLQTIRS